MRRLIVFGICLILKTSILSAQQFELPKNWKFSKSDSMIFAGKDYNDLHWKQIEIGKSWQQNGIPHEGTSWYRLEVKLVDVIKDAVEKNGEAILNLGMVDDCDSTWFNGQLIGTRGKFPPDFYSAWGSYRQYEISPELINWNGSNTIAVKVYSPDTIGGGISDGPFWIGVPQKKIWYSKIPEDCPFEKSADIQDIALTGKFAKYTRADTWYPSWADNGNMYSGFTDGILDGVRSRSGFSENATTGQAVIKGDNPMNLDIRSLGLDTASALPFQGRYPCAYLCHNGVVYIGTYLLDDSNKDATDSLQWDIVSPFVGFRYSTDYGKTWIKCPHDGYNPLFPEKNSENERVKFGAPHVVDFGKNMQYSPDGKAYMVGHGSSPDDPNPRIANSGWVTGDQVYLCRMETGPDKINRLESYEFFAGYDKSNKSLWSKNIKEAKPLLEWNNNMGCVTMTYNPYFKKYIMSITDGGNGMGTMNTYFLEADNITGPYKIITYWENFGPQAYFVNMPSKFIYKNNRMWLCFSGNYYSKPLPFINEPYGSDYGMCLFEMEFFLNE